MLNIGDTIGIIALSGDCDIEKAENSRSFFESLGYSVKLSKNIFDKNRYLAGNDEDKLAELHKFYKDGEIKLILCARGGYGAIRIVNQIDYELIKANPKPFCGFSDVTALLLMIYKKTGVITYHSPMACTDFAGENNSYSSQAFFDAISGKHIECQGDIMYKEGSAEGILWGGNLSTVVSLCGQDFIPEKDFIFFAEDLNEPVYKIDKMFQQLINIPQFIKYCKGIALGDFLDTDNQLWLEEYFKEMSVKLDLPVCGGFKITHAAEKITLPIGKSANLENNKLIIS